MMLVICTKNLIVSKPPPKARMYDENGLTDISTALLNRVTYPAHKRQKIIPIPAEYPMLLPNKITKVFIIIAPTIPI